MPAGPSPRRGCRLYISDLPNPRSSRKTKVFKLRFTALRAFGTVSMLILPILAPLRRGFFLPASQRSLLFSLFYPILREGIYVVHSNGYAFLSHDFRFGPARPREGGGACIE